MATILPHTAQRVRRLEDTLLACLGRWGYQEVIPPTFEYLDVLAAGLEPELIEKCYKIADRTTGRILLLRPDVTAQIARIVAMGMAGAEVPLRLCYRTTVFRYEPEHAGREREIFQVGAELIGVDSVAMDGEIIALMGDCLRQLGLSAFRISLGHVGFFKGLLARSGLSQEGQKRAEQAAARKDLPKLADILLRERVPGRTARALLEAPRLFGGDEVLERGRALAGRNRELRAALDRLTQVYRLLDAAGLKGHLLLDLGEFRGFEYYDGVVFDVFAEGLGCELGGGGRYNHLIGRFGRPQPSTGFAFDVDRLFRAMERSGNGSPPVRADVLVAAQARAGARLFQAAQRLRAAGLRVLQDTVGPAGPAAQQAALAAARRAGALAAVLVGLPGCAADEALLLGAGTRTSRIVKIEDLPAALRGGAFGGGAS
ncbi:ATP phosphoribosyltransferase regulatory subunit [Nitrospira sp. Kam-Ns4a]